MNKQFDGLFGDRVRGLVAATTLRLQAIFRNPHYRGPYLVWRQKGDAYVDAVIQEVRQIWRPNAIGGPSHA